MSVKHNYIKEGSGDVLILLHGNGESLEYFKNQIEAFKNHFAVYALDTRGHGKTPRGDGEFSLSKFTDDLNDFMTIHKIEKAHLVGFSDGGNIAMMFALRYPEKVNELVLNGANMYPRGLKATVYLEVLLVYVISKVFAGISQKAAKKAELFALMVHEPSLTEEKLAEIKAPTLVIAGTNDMIRDSHTRTIGINIPGAVTKFVKGSHFVAAENPNEFNQTVLEFLLGGAHEQVRKDK